MKLTVGRPVDKKFPISSPFGIRVWDGKPKQHNGIDFKCPVNTHIRAVADGEVIRSGWENAYDPTQGYGLRVYQRIQIGKEFYYVIYAHLSKPLVIEGSKLKEGDLVALSGNTGRSTGPHLHIGIRKENTKEFFDMDFYDLKPKSEVA